MRACGWAAARMSGRIEGRLSQRGSSRRITPPVSPEPRPVMISTQRMWSALAAWMKRSSAWKADCAVLPWRSRVLAGTRRPPWKRCQEARSRPGGWIPVMRVWLGWRGGAGLRAGCGGMGGGAGVGVCGMTGSSGARPGSRRMSRAKACQRARSCSDRGRGRRGMAVECRGVRRTMHRGRDEAVDWERGV